MTQQISPWQARQIKRVVQAGGIIAYPTEAVYGLGCDPLDADAVTRLLALKQRPISKGLILIASGLAQLAPYLAPLEPRQMKTLQASWPGPTTWVVPSHPHCPVWLTGQHHSIAVRVTKHPIAQSICDSLGHALVSTSANPTNRKPARSALKVKQYFADQVDYIIHQHQPSQAAPTEIRELLSGKILRASS